MRKTILSLLCMSIVLLATCLQGWAFNQTYVIQPTDIHGGYFVQKILLTHDYSPNVAVNSFTYSEVVQLPKGARADDPAHFTLMHGTEAKKPFIVVRVPAYSVINGKLQQLTGCNIAFDEEPFNNQRKTASKFADVSASVLANGTWYKIGVTKTGFYKLDFAFFNSLGISAGSINPSDIRIYGNGGNVLSEDNSVPRPADLIENAIWVNNGGGNNFKSGDFVVFYATGTTAWKKDSANSGFTHKNNPYTDTAYYFITVTNGAGKRIQNQGTPPASNTSATGFDYRDVHELDLVSPIKYGKSWYGEMFSDQVGNNQNISMDLVDIASHISCRYTFGCIQPNGGSTMQVTLNGTPLSNITCYKATNSDDLIGHCGDYATLPINSRTANFSFTFTPSPLSATGSCVAYLQYLEITARRALSFAGAGQFGFRDWQTVGAGKVASYTLQGATPNTQVWDVTNPQVPVLMNGVLSGSAYTFTQNADYLHEFAATNLSDFYSAVGYGKVDNQNLHGLPQSDLVIVAYPGFYNAAKKVADFHASHDHMSVALVTTQQVYNEFSSGSQDISAFRDLMRMFYNRAKDSSTLPKYLLMFGNGSYDYKNRINNNSNYVPTFESGSDSSDLDGFLTDDFFGFLDDNEYIENYNILNVLDIGVGRIPARSVDDANVAADKIVNYSSPASLGPWRVASMFVAEASDDAGDHLGDAEVMAQTVNGVTNNLYNEQKVYVNAMPVISTPGGGRCPNANAAINDQIFQGVFSVNYNGHGNPQVWANERILTQDDFNNWKNANSLPFMTTATCDFGQFDQNTASAAELLMLHQGGGAIAMITTTGAVYETFNQPMNQDFLIAQFSKKSNGKWNTFGDAYEISKNLAYIDSPSSDEIANFRKFVLLGDPALTPDFPQYNIQLDSILDGVSLRRADTVKALGKYTLYGSARDQSGNVLNDFNGTLNISFFDKPTSYTVNTLKGVHTFNTQLNLIYRGTVSVTDGKYSVSFIAPKDINYFNGKGKISTYAQNGITDAAGADSSLVVGGFSDNPVVSNTAPVVLPFISDSFFVDGGITGSNTSLFVILTSETGINVTGYGVGHNLTAVLDGNNEQPYILNNYYETAPNTYQRGYVTFPIQGLANGKHTLKVKAYDVNNNSGTGSVDFTVVEGKVVDIQNLGNYPNPFDNLTHFVFEHNHPDEQLNVQIGIYNTAGTAVKTIEQDFTPSGSRSFDITWDGTANDGGRLPSGVYVYRLTIKTTNGYKTTAYQKLVIVR